jgi:hypothetical protein
MKHGSRLRKQGLDNLRSMQEELLDRVTTRKALAATTGILNHNVLRTSKPGQELITESCHGFLLA